MFLFGHKRPPLQKPYAVTFERVRCLTDILTEPTKHTQRFVEEVSFVPTGGQRWIRKLQIELPRSTSSSNDWWIVPLGPFARRRFADIAVTNAEGSRVNLVTRSQHGVALAKVALATHFTDLPSFSGSTSNGVTKVEYDSLYKAFQKQLFAYYTKMGDKVSQKADRKALLSAYEQLLGMLSVPEKEPEAGPSAGQPGQNRLLKKFSDDLIEASDSTQYLCWVQAPSATVVNLEVSYTTSDPKHKLEDGSIRDLLSALRTGLLGVVSENHDKRRDVWNSWFAQFGLAPVSYVFNTPTHQYATSHYSMVRPPKNAWVTYLDWGSNNSRNGEAEIDSSLSATHIFNSAEEPYSHKRDTTHAFLRCAPYHHKQILGVALLNFVLVVLLAVGRFPGNGTSPLQDLLVAVPSILMVFIAQQQRHYYAHALRRSRAIFWGYLFVDVAFLVAVAFNGRVDGHGTPGIGWKATIAAWALAVTSVLMFVWQAPLGKTYERIVNYLMDRRQKALFGSYQRVKYIWLQKWRDRLFGWKWRDIRTPWQRYESAVEWYCRLIRAFLVLSGMATLGLLVVFWHPARPERENRGHTVFVSHTTRQTRGLN